MDSYAIPHGSAANPAANQLAERLRLARVTRRHSQEELAQRAGIRQSQISRIEGGQIAAPTFADVAALAKALGISLNALAAENATGFISELARVAEEIDRGEAGERVRVLLPERLLIDDPYTPPSGLLPVGILEDDGEAPQILALDNEILDRHMFITGQTGTGKSELLRWLIFGAAKADYPVILLDPHGSLADDVLDSLLVSCPERADDIVWVDFSNAEHPPAWNPLDIEAPDAIENTVSAVLEMLDKQLSLGAGAPRAVNLASQAVAALCEANLALKGTEVRCTLLHVVTFFLDVEFRRLVMGLCTNPSICETFDPEKGPFEILSDKQQAEFAMPIIRAFSAFCMSSSFSAVFSTDTNQLDFGQLIAANKIILVKLGRFAHQRKLGEVAGALLLPMLLSSIDTWGRRRDPETGEYHGRGCRLFIDEAPSLIAPRSTIVELLLESRRWDLGCAFSCQYPSQFDQPLPDTLLRHCGTRLSFRLDPAEADILADESLGGTPLAASLPDIPNYSYLLSTTAAPEQDQPVSLLARSLPLLRSDLTSHGRNLREAVRRHSWDEYCSVPTPAEADRSASLELLKSELTRQLGDR